MSDLLSYIHHRGDLNFIQDPFNKVDNLILARLSYIDFEDIKNGENLNTISKKYMNKIEKWSNERYVTTEVRPLLIASGNSDRFGNIRVKNYVNIVDEITELQFSATTLEIDNNTAYIAFRGTDDTLVGWKEDLNMIHLDYIPAQEKAKEYLEDIFTKTEYNNIYVGGHSKGGNLAVYSSININSKHHSRIKGVFNNDGPGFKKSITEKEEYLSISDKIHNLMPQNSIVGLFLEKVSNYQIIKTKVSKAIEHNTFNWMIYRNDFVYIDDFTDDIKFVDLTTKKVLQRLNTEQRKTFVDVIYAILSSNNCKTISEINNDVLGNVVEATKKFNSLDDITKEAVSVVLESFFKEAYCSFLKISELDKIKIKFLDWTEEGKKHINKILENK